jgi:predicted DNA-binding protein
MFRLATYLSVAYSVTMCYNRYERKEMIFVNTITVRLNKDEAKIYKEYAEFKNMPLSTLMKEALESKIEEEIDLKAIIAYEERLKENEVDFIPFDEVKKRLGL